MSHSVQRGYAFAVLSLRALFKLTPFDSAYEWKTRTIIIFSGFNFASAIMARVSIAARWDALLDSTPALVCCLASIWSVCWWAQGTAESRLVHRFEGEFRHLSRATRITMAIGMVLFVVLSILAVSRTARAIHAHRLAVLATATAQGRLDLPAFFESGHPFASRIATVRGGATE